MPTQQPAQHIDLHLPRGWNQCTTRELELIAACILRHTYSQDRYHPFDWMRVKTELFFLLTGVEVLGTAQTAPAAEEPAPAEAEFTCRLRRRSVSRRTTSATQQPQSRWYHRLPLPGKGSATTFTLKAWQVHSFIDQHLSWLDDDKAPSLLIFPYKRRLPYLALTKGWLTTPWGWQLPYPRLERRYHTPGELLQDFTWQQYRHLQDYMEQYIRRQNALAAEAERAARAAATAASAAVPSAAVPAASPAGTLTDPALTEARNHFLAVLFHCEEQPHRVSTIGDVEWLIILWWWHGTTGTGGIMGYLMKKYPRVFKTTTHQRRPRRQAVPNPLDIYVSIVATMQSENHLTEDEVNRQTFHIVLEQLERLAQKNEELEKINRKHK